MSLLELFIIAVGLSMDAFAVSICKGLTLRKKELPKAVTAGLWFGLFQGIMPLAGFFLGARFSSLVEDCDHWIAFVLLAFIGGRMIWESRRAESCPDPSFRWNAMLPLAVATSIDALAVGVSFAFLRVNIFIASGIIAATTFVLSVAGTEAGRAFGSRYKSRAELAGGIILIAIGTKILIQHLMA